MPSLPPLQSFIRSFQNSRHTDHKHLKQICLVLNTIHVLKLLIQMVRMYLQVLIGRNTQLKDMAKLYTMNQIQEIWYMTACLILAFLMVMCTHITFICNSRAVCSLGITHKRWPTHPINGFICKNCWSEQKPSLSFHCMNLIINVMYNWIQFYHMT